MLKNTTYTILQDFETLVKAQEITQESLSMLYDDTTIITLTNAYIIKKNEQEQEKLKS